MRAAYDGIYLELKQLIEDGTYTYQSLLPSEAVLVKRFGCAHNTVRKALSVLAAEGYVQPIHGKGVRVIYRPDFTPPSGQLYVDGSLGIESFDQMAKRCGFSAQTVVRLMDYLNVDKELASRVPFEVNQCLLHLVRVRLVNDKPLAWESNYFRSDVVTGITKRDAKDSVYRFIEASENRRLVTCRHKVTLDHAADKDYELLSMGNADYVAVIRTISFDNNGMLCEYSEHRLHPSVFMVQLTAQRTRINAS